MQMVYSLYMTIDVDLEIFENKGYFKDLLGESVKPFNNSLGLLRVLK